ncbi:MAG: DUF2141 domain-containing protein [Crocinitomicaceae bacterium]|nr:DUF2141 domain-containing protein [Crocinitomicaceae bacterium]
MLAVILAILLPLFDNTDDLTVVVSGCKSQKGQLFIALYDDKDIFPIFGKQLIGEIVPLSKTPRHEFTFKDLAHKTYAIAVFHDLNSNGKLDKNAIGLPLEPYGFSNNARNTFSAPSFSQASFVHGDEQSISISVK